MGVQTRHTEKKRNIYCIFRLIMSPIFVAGKIGSIIIIYYYFFFGISAMIMIFFEIVKSRNI